MLHDFRSPNLMRLMFARPLPIRDRAGSRRPSNVSIYNHKLLSNNLYK